jgi:hypothetical protein
MRTLLLPICVSIVWVFGVSYVCWALHRRSASTKAAKSPGGVIGLLWRLAVMSVLCWPMLKLYAYLNDDLSAPRTTVVMPSWVPFWPAFAGPYLAMLWVTWLLPVTIRDTRRFWACLLAMACAYLLCIPGWILVPTTLPRPPLPEGWWAGLYRGLAAIDPPNNVMPAAHGVGPMVAAWFAGRDRPTWRWPLAGMLALGVPSIALIWQHRPIDIALGTVAAVVGIAIGEALVRRKQASVKDDEIDT